MPSSRQEWRESCLQSMKWLRSCIHTWVLRKPVMGPTGWYEGDANVVSYRELEERGTLKGRKIHTRSTRFMDTLRLMIAAIFILSGCAESPTKGMTPAEAQAYEVQANYERDNRRILTHEAILTARAQCHADNMVWMVQRQSASDSRRMSRDPTWLPRNVSVFDFSCATQYEASAALRNLMGYY